MQDTNKDGSPRAMFGVPFFNYGYYRRLEDPALKAEGYGGDNDP